MSARNFRELLDAIPAERRHKVEQRVRETIAAMPFDKLRRARQNSAGQARAESLAGC